MAFPLIEHLPSHILTTSVHQMPKWSSSSQNYNQLRSAKKPRKRPLILSMPSQECCKASETIRS